MVRVGINGFGIIGRAFFRAVERDVRDGFLSQGKVEVVAVNDVFPALQLAHLLSHNSVYGAFNERVGVIGNNLVVNDRMIDCSMEKDTFRLKWADRGVDVVYDSSGVFSDDERGLKGHLDAGAKKVVVSSPSKFAEKTIVMGVNDSSYNGEKVISNASCTTNCLAPLALALYNSFGPFDGIMTTVHAYTQDQRLQDAPHKDVARAYNAVLNIVPTSTGAAKAIGEVIPQLKGKLDGIAVRVPVAAGSLVDLVVSFENKVERKREDVNSLLRDIANGYLKGTLGYNEGPLVSSMILGERIPSVVDGSQTRVVGNNLKVISWYDNVMGYSHQAVKLIKKIGESL